MCEHTHNYTYRGREYKCDATNDRMWLDHTGSILSAPSCQLHLKPLGLLPSLPSTELYGVACFVFWSQSSFSFWEILFNISASQQLASQLETKNETGMSKETVLRKSPLSVVEIPGWPTSSM